MKIQVQIEWQDIFAAADEGTSTDGDNDPIARALKRAGFTEVFVSSDGVLVSSDTLSGYTFYPLPPAGQTFIADLADDKLVEPFTLSLEVP